MYIIQASAPSIFNKKSLVQACELFLFWTLIAAIFTTKSNIIFSLQGISTSWIHLSIHHVASAWTWIAVTPIIYWIYLKISSSERSLIQKVILLPIAMIFAALLHNVISLTLDIGFRIYLHYIEGSIWQHLWNIDSLMVSGFIDSTLIFLLIMAFFYAWDMFHLSNPGLWRWDKKAHSAGDERHISNSLMVKHNGQFIFIDCKKLVVVSAEGNYVKLHLFEQSTLLIRETMANFLVRLDQETFIRINRSIIINSAYVLSLQPVFNGEYSISLTDGTQANTSKRFGDQWKQLLQHA